MVWDTCVHETILCVTFGARLRSVPVRLLDDLLGHFVRQGRPRTPERLAKRPFEPPTSRSDALRTLLRHARGYVRTSGQVYSVGGSAMHM